MAKNKEKKEISVYQKTIFKKFPDFKTFWAQAKTVFLHATPNSKDKVNAYWFAWKVYDYWKLNRYWGSEEQFFGKFYTRLATYFQELKRREDLYQKLYPNIKLQADKLVNIKTTETTTPSKEITKGIKKGLSSDKQWNSENKDIGQVKGISKEKPLSSLDLIAGEYGIENRADWLQVEMETAYGLRSKEGDKIKFNPNWATTKGHSHDKTHLNEDNVKIFGQGKKTITSQEQPIYTQQIAKIIQSFSLVELPLTEYVIDGFSDLFFNVYLPQGEFVFDSNSQEFKYITREELEEEETEEKAKERKSFDRLSEEKYLELKAQGVAVEDTLDLENLVRFKERVKTQKGKGQETKLKALEGLIMAYTRQIYWPTLDNYDKVMKGITGFKSFKQELRNRTEIANYYNRIRKKMPQVFYCLLGKPGVGKSEISKTLAKAYKRPFNVIGMAGQAHPKILKGMRPTLDNAKYGRVVESFVDSRANIFITRTEHEAELNRLQTKPNKTKNQLEYIKWLETEIEEIKKQEATKGKLESELNSVSANNLEGEIKREKLQDKINSLTGKFYDLPSQAPIILLDESEKVKDETVLFIVGQITDRELNYWYEDEFLEYGINLGQALILLTANYAERVPDFVRSRCKFVNIQLLTFAERLQILQIRREALIREFFPAERFNWESQDAPESEIDKYNKRHGLLTDEQQEVRNKVNDNFLTWCITETFGVREAIMNLMAVMDFLVLAKTRGVLTSLPNLDNPDDRQEINNADGSGEINLGFHEIRDAEDNYQYLTLIKKRDVEWKKKEKSEEGQAESVLNLIKDWPTYQANWKPTN